MPNVCVLVHARSVMCMHASMYGYIIFGVYAHGVLTVTFICQVRPRRTYINRRLQESPIYRST